MKKFTHKNLLALLKSKAILALSGGLLLSTLTSCVVYTGGGYSETDGVYYDPNKDTIPEGTVMNSENRVGEDYNYQANENSYQNWRENQNSDWGLYTGTDTYYNDYWGYPYGMYSGFGWGLSYGWGSPWSYYNPWYGYYNPWYGYYSPWYSGYYGNPYGYYYPNYGYGSYGNTYNGGFLNKRSGVNGSFRDGNNLIRHNNSGGFRNTNNGVRNNNTGGFRNQQTIRNQNDSYNNSPRVRTTTPRQQQTPRYDAPVRNNNSNGGFRGNDGGGFRGSSSGGGFNSGSSGGTRSSGGGGFRR